MNFFIIVIKNLRQRMLSVLLTMSSIMLGICLVTTIIILKKESEESFSQTATGYELIVGPKGSPLQLTLNTVYQIGLPLGSMPLKTYELLKNDKRVKLAIPYVLGDNYKDHRLVGTVPEIFTSFEYKKGIRYNFISGTPFSGEFEAVAGHDAAVKTGLKTGDYFTGSHGVNSYEGAEEHDENKFKVTGILEKTYTPADNVIFVSMSSVWKIHDYVSHDHSQTGSADSNDNKTISSVLVSLKSPVYFDLLRRQINDNKYEGINAQAVIPVFEIKQLFDIIGNINSILLLISYLVILVAAISIFVVLYNSLNERKKEIAIMRSIGAKRSLIMKLIIAEGTFIALTGTILGTALSHMLIFLFRNKLSELAGIQISGNSFSIFEIYIIAGAGILGIIVSIIPALRAYRTDAVSQL